MFACVCSDCGIDVYPNEQYWIRTENGDTRPVCPDCAKKYGFNLEDEKENV